MNTMEVRGLLVVVVMKVDMVLVVVEHKMMLFHLLGGPILYQMQVIALKLTMELYGLHLVI